MVKPKRANFQATFKPTNWRTRNTTAGWYVNHRRSEQGHHRHQQHQHQQERHPYQQHPTANMRKTGVEGVDKQVRNNVSNVHDINEGGWTTVQRRRQNPVAKIQVQVAQRSRSQANQGKSFASKEIQEEYERAFKERRCFRCLGKGHIKAYCREPMCCFKCKGYGHNSGRCGKFTRQQLPIKEGVRIKQRPLAQENHRDTNPKPQPQIKEVR